MRYNSSESDEDEVLSLDYVTIGKVNDTHKCDIDTVYLNIGLYQLDLKLINLTNNGRVSVYNDIANRKDQQNIAIDIDTTEEKLKDWTETTPLEHIANRNHC